MKMIDGLRMVQSGQAPPPAVAQLIGMGALQSVEPGAVSIEMEVDAARHGNPMGTVHGGILCDLVDAAMGMTYASTLEEGETFTTLELKINFFKPVWRAKLLARAKMVRTGRTVGMVECDVVDEKDSLVARASSTCMTLRGEQGKGR